MDTSKNSEMLPQELEYAKYRKRKIAMRARRKQQLLNNCSRQAKLAKARLALRGKGRNSVSAEQAMALGL